MPLFETRALCKHYRASSPNEVRAVDQVTLGIEPGSLTVLTGPSGSGKTTLLALLGALERPSSGQLFFDGNEFTGSSDVALARLRRRMGFIFQDFALIPNLSVLENITYPLIPRQVPRRERGQRAQALLAQFGMADKRAVRARELSGGEQQRVAIARGLAGHPDVLLADEPTSNLDAETTRILLSVLGDLHRENRTILVASHDPRIVAMATSTLQIEGGKLATTHDSS